MTSFLRKAGVLATKGIDFERLEARLAPTLESISKEYHGVTASLSGGPDSTLLFFFLLHLAKQKKIILSGAIHFNFCLRGDESDGDQAFVENLCNRFNVSLKCLLMKAEKAPISRGNIQLWAREARRKVYREEQKNGRLIALGHSLDDQAETLMMRLGRGTGPQGLGGMRDLGGGLWRPLLCVSKEAIGLWLGAKGEACRQDSSNQTVKFRRNLIRHRVMPPFNEAYPKGSEHLAALAMEMQGVFTLARRQAAPLTAAALSPLGIAVQRLVTLDRGVRLFVLREICRQALAKTPGGLRKKRSDGILPWVEALEMALLRPDGEPGKFILTLSTQSELVVADGFLLMRAGAGPLQHQRHRQSKGSLGGSYIDLMLGPGGQARVPFRFGGVERIVVITNKNSLLNMVRLQRHKSSETLRFKGSERKIKLRTFMASTQVTSQQELLSVSLVDETLAVFDGTFFNSINAQGEKIAYCGLLEILIE